MKIAFLRSGPLNLTPGVERHVAFLRGAGFRGEMVGLELDFQPNRPAVDFVDELITLRASYRNRLQRAAMMLRWQLFQMRHLWRLRPDVILICDVFSAIPALLVKALRRTKVIFDVRDPAGMSLSHWGRILSASLGALESFAAARSDVVVMVSEPLKALLTPGTQKKTVVIPNAPLQDVFPGMQFSGDGKLRVNLAGFISHRRNLNAWCEVAKADPNVQLDLYGAVYEDQTVEILQRHGLGSPQKIPLQEAIDRTRSADVVSLMYDPAVEINRYAAPNKYFEALMLGKPVICAQGMHLAEEVVRAGCGISVPYGDAAELRKGIAQLGDAAARQRMGEAARRHWLACYCGAPVRARAEVYRRAGVLPA